MTHTLRPLSLGQLLDETFDIYRHHWLLFVGISAIPNLAWLVLQVVVEAGRIGKGEADSVATWVAVLGGLFAYWFVNAVATAATTVAVSDIYLDRPTGIAACFSRVGRKGLRVGYVSVVVSLIVGLGFVLCLAPGIYWAGLYGMAVPAVVLEKISGNAALSRSSELARNSVGRVIVVYFLTSILVFIISTALAVAVDALFPAFVHPSGLITKETVQQVITSVSETLFGPVTAIGLTLIYYDQRVRKEAFDIQHMMQLMTTSENVASGTSA